MATLFLVSTPIGNLDDITFRALHTLFQVDYIACEDTRVTGNLLEVLKNKYSTLLSSTKKPELLSYRNDNEQTVIPSIIALLREGKSVALVSDAGTPLISDPGFRLVTESLKRAIPIEVIPGVSAFVTAITGSGLPANSIVFLGFLPEKASHRLGVLQKLISLNSLLPSTYALYVAPHKLQQTLDDMHNVFSNIPIVLSRELTKLHEEFFRGTIQEAKTHFTDPKGEFVLLFTL
jgi:16S rRNA (cytidine1402-2'-O)-methyltransferase